MELEGENKFFREDKNMSEISSNSALNSYAADYSYRTEHNKKTDSNKKADVTKEADRTTKKSKVSGRTIGDPVLSDKAQKYYEKLKKKYGNYDFILVSKDQKANAQANAAKYANNIKTVVLIDEEKIERMATDESYRKKYEGILSGATAQLQQLKSSVEKSGADVKEYGMQVNDGGTTSFFAVLRKSSSDQKSRIQKSAEKKKAEKKAAEKKAEKKQEKERLEKSKESRTESEDDTQTITLTANSVEERMDKIGEYTFVERSNEVRTDREKLMGQHVDYKL